MTKSERLQKAYRQYADKKNFPTLISEVAQGLDRPRETIIVVPSERSDELWQMYLAKRSQALDGQLEASSVLVHVWPAIQREEMLEGINKLKECIPQQPVVLFRTVTGTDWWAIRSTTTECLERIFSLTSRDQDDLMVMSEDGTKGLSFEYHSYGGEIGDEEVYELLLWGKEWMIQPSETK